MKILIVEDDVINASKLKLLYSKYGNCELVSDGEEALEKFVDAYEQSAPYSFISLEMDMKEMKGIDVLSEIKQYERENNIEPGKGAKILLMVTQSSLAEAASYINQEGIFHIVKPYNRKKLEAQLMEIGLEKAPEPESTSQPKPAPKPAPKPVEKKPDVDPAEARMVTAKMTALLSQADQLEGRNAQHVFEGLVRRGGKEAELLLGQYISSDKLPNEIRIELIRAAGEVRGPHFLIPLNKTINSTDNIKLIQECYLAIGKYCDQKALNMLTQGLQKFKHPQLMNAIRDAIQKIKDKRPVLGILPRFLTSHTSLKNFRVTVDILKKIFKPEDTDLIINYFKSTHAVIGDGTFEILCYGGDASIKTSLINYFDDRVQKIPCLAEKECSALFQLLRHLSYYLERFPEFIEELFPEFKELYPRVADVSSKELILGLIARSQRPEALDFLKKIFNEEEKFQETIIEKLSGNQQAVDFLFEKYHSGKTLKEKVITSLLKSEQGLKYFIQHFFTFELEQQETIIKNISFSHEPYLMEFISKIYESNLYRLKFLLLRTLRDHFLFDFKHILFDEENQREFIFMGKDYFTTIVHLFPITTFKMFFNKIAFEDLSNNKIKKYLDFISEVAISEPVLQFRDAKFVEKLFERISNANNLDLNVTFFKALENVKTLDLKTYRMLREATQTFTEIRGAHINEKEKAAINKFMKNLKEQFPDIRQVESILKELNIVFSNKPIMRDRLEKLIEGNHPGVSLKILYVATYLANKFKMAETISMEDKDLFMVKYPFLAKFIRHVEEHDPELKIAEDWTIPPDNNSLLSHFKENLRIVLSFDEKWMSAFFKDQFHEILPEFEVVLDAMELRDTDILVTDPKSLRGYITRQALGTSRIFLFLESRVDFAPFRSLNPRAFMRPLSGYRLVRLILNELFLLR